MCLRSVHQRGTVLVTYLMPLLQTSVYLVSGQRMTIWGKDQMSDTQLETSKFSVFGCTLLLLSLKPAAISACGS